jgi:pyruvate,orthophosphate dikinase
MSPKYVYFFGAGSADGNMKMKDILGGKGANLAEMAGLGLPVPPGFTVSTAVCDLFYRNKKRIPDAVKFEVEKNLKKLEKTVGQVLGDPKNPLLVSIRSGARASMPGMMDTILNLGLNEKTVAALIAKTNNPRFVYDSYRRFVQMYGDVVLDLKPVNKDDIDPFEAIIEQKKHERGIHSDTDLTADDLKDLAVRFKAAIKAKTGHDFPEDPMKQMWGAVGAVFSSWMNDRAIAYRKMYDIPESWGTAVNVQLMRKHVLRRIPDERPGRGRRRRHPDAAPHHPSEKGRREILRPARKNPPYPREALHRHDGCRVHHPAGPTLHAPMPGGETHRLRGD